ncbi:hypothetical protein LOK49_LG10G00570 [Camellia lanceoleosa]|uniref:Uncharacterized protein n=1 Tax=Camellia lanceoleosa TaxID=1840588 RepID=A0ACC0GAS3_9ERIC|nr:hypothetical protein LOK49_LG10G00570 [Camellia lanceoleosa]
MCIPAGVALGYVYGGFVAGHSNWCFAFFGEAIVMVPFAILGFVIKPLQLKALADAEIAVIELKDGILSVKEEFIDQSSKGPSKLKSRSANLNQISRFLKDMKVLLLDKVYVVNVLGILFTTLYLQAFIVKGFL